MERAKISSKLSPSQRVINANLQAKVELNAKAARMRSQGIRVIDMSGYLIERPYGSIETPTYVLDATRKTLDNGWPPPSLRGLQSLRETIAHVEKVDKKIDTDPNSEIIVSSGGTMQALYNVLQALIHPNDEVLVFRPGLGYDEQVKLAEGIPIYIDLKESEGYKYNSDNIRKAITSKTKMVILNSPHNPTGHVATRQELMEIAEVVEDHDLLVLSDEVLWKWVFSESEFVSFASIPGMKERTIRTSGVTKIGMFDWRIGWVAGSAELMQQIEKIMFWQNQFSPPILQVAAQAHLERLDQWIQPIIRLEQEKRDILYEGLMKAGFSCFKPQGTLTTFPSIVQFANSSTVFSGDLLENAHILVSPGIAYLGEGHLRVGFGNDKQEIVEAIERINRFTTPR
jgi:aspartate/methionine/tyrosine aminotransferase